MRSSSIASTATRVSSFAALPPTGDDGGRPMLAVAPLGLLVNVAACPVLRQLQETLARRSGIDHATIQLERERCADRVPCYPRRRTAEAEP